MSADIGTFIFDDTCELSNDLRQSTYVKKTYFQSQISIGYKNYTRKDVRVKSRLGITSIINSENYNNNVTERELYDLDKFVISVRLRGDLAEYRVIESDLIESSKQSRVSAALLRELQNEAKYAGKSGSFELVVHFTISPHQIDSNQSTIYLPELDITLDFDPRNIQETRVPHPYEPSRLDMIELSGKVEGPFTLDKDSLIVSMKAYDNTGFKTHSDKYVFLAGRVQRLKITYSNKPGGFTGVVVRRNQCTSNSPIVTSKTDSIERYTFEEAAKIFGIANTIEEATTLGDSKLKLVEEIKAKDREFDELKRNHDVAMVNAKIEADRINAELTKKKLEYSKEDTELFITRRELDHKINTTKSWFDFGKMFASAAVALAGLVAWFIKTKKVV